MTYRPYAAIISAASSQQASIKASLKNSTGATIPDLTPVRANTNGEMARINVSIEFQATNVVGLTSASVLDSAFGDVILSGKLENISGFNFGDIIYISKSGGLTSTQPSEGVGDFVAGDFIIRVGVIVKNDSIGTQKDLLLSINVIGQL